MCVVAPCDRVRNLVPALVRERWTVQEIRHAERKAADAADGDLGGQPERGNSLSGYGGLSAFEFEAPSVLIPQLIGEGVGGRAGKARDSAVALYEIDAGRLTPAVHDG